MLTNWIKEVEQLHNSNKWLLFFRIPKLIALYQILKSKRCDVSKTRIHQEVGFLFQRDVTTRQELDKALEVSCSSRNCIISRVSYMIFSWRASVHPPAFCRLKFLKYLRTRIVGFSYDTYRHYSNRTVDPI